MKSLTQNILNDIKREDFMMALRQFPVFVISEGRGNNIPGMDGVILEEQLLKLDQILRFLEKHKKLIDGRTYSKRETVYNILSQQIVVRIIQTVNKQQGQGIITSLAQAINSVYDLLYADLTAKGGKELVSEGIEELNELKAMYRESITKLEQILKNRDVIDKFLSARDTITVIEELKNQAKSKKEEIDSLGGLIDNYENSYELELTKLQDLNESHKQEYDKRALENSRFKSELEVLISKNLEVSNKLDEFKNRIETLLEKAVSGKASEAFSIKSKEIKANGWIVGLILGMIAFVVICIWSINYFKIDDLKEFLFRISLVLPVGMLEIFFYNQYNFYQKLKEEYSFKSIAAGTMDGTIKILQNYSERHEYKEYIQTLSKDIMKSPIQHDNKIGFGVIKPYFDKMYDTLLKNLEDVKSKKD